MIVGKTTDGRPVVKGLAKFYFQDGLPLQIVFDGCNKHKIVVSWNDLYSELKENGMKHERIIHLLHEQMFEAFSNEYRSVVLDRLNKLS